MVDVRIDAMFAFAPVAVLLQPLAQERHQFPLAGVDLFGERGDGFRTRWQRAEGIAEDVAEECTVFSLSLSICVVSSHVFCEIARISCRNSGRLMCRFVSPTVANIQNYYCCPVQRVLFGLASQIRLK